MRLPAWLKTALIVAAGLAAWSNTAQVPLLFDDAPSLLHNSSLRALGLGMLAPPPDTTLSGRPFANASFALNYALGGLRLWPLHATNLALHLAAALVLLALVRQTLVLPRFGGRFEKSAEGIALVAALVWMLHPVQTESVTYLVQRVEVLAGLFLLITVYAALRAHAAERPFAWSATAVLACGLGMGSKETMAVAPLLVLLFDRAFLFGSVAEAMVRRRRLYLALCATWLVLALQLATHPRGLSAGFHFTRVGPVQYLGIQLFAVFRYLRVLLVPTGLVFDYGEPGVAVTLAHSPWQWGLAGAALLALFGLALWACWRFPAAGFLAVSFFLLLSPSSSFIPIATEVISEHRLYLPSAPALLLLLLGAHAVARRRHGLAAALGVALVLSLATLTYRRNRDYSTAASIWQDTTRKRPQNPRAWAGLARAFQDAGEIPRAMDLYRHALRLEPYHQIALLQLARLEEGSADATHDPHALDRAIDLYQRYLAQRGGEPDVHLNLAHSLEKRGRLKEALDHYQKAMALQPGDAEIAGDAANCLTRAGLFAPAEERYRTALSLRPDWDLGHYNYAAMLARTGKYDEALAEFQKALGLNPALVRAWHRAGVVAAWAGRPAEAVKDLEMAIQLEPSLAEAMEDLAWLLATHPDAEVRDGRRALHWAEKAEAVHETSRSLDVLGAAQAENARFDLALRSVEKAQALWSGRDPRREAMQARTTSYRKRIPWRETPAPGW